jgi:hypothetical protein
MVNSPFLLVHFPVGSISQPNEFCGIITVARFFLFVNHFSIWWWPNENQGVIVVARRASR